MGPEAPGLPSAADTSGFAGTGSPEAGGSSCGEPQETSEKQAKTTAKTAAAEFFLFINKIISYRGFPNTSALGKLPLFYIKTDLARFFRKLPQNSSALGKVPSSLLHL
jgi:hypothetical protein